MKEKKLTMREVRSYVSRISRFIVDRYHTIDVDLLAVCRGGMIPATMIAHHLGCHNIYVVKLRSYMDDINKKVSLKDLTTDSIPDQDYRKRPLIMIDDICDSGDTLRYMKEVYKPDMCITLVRKLIKDKKDLPDYYCLTTNASTWVKFPWEMNYEK